MIEAATFPLAEQLMAELSEAHPVLVQLLETGQGEKSFAGVQGGRFGGCASR
jgi:hypothetical protein